MLVQAILKPKIKIILNRELKWLEREIKFTENQIKKGQVFYNALWEDRLKYLLEKKENNIHDFNNL